MNNNIRYELKLSFIDPILWNNRSLPIASTEWKKLRIKILERDNFQCSFCGIRSSKYMIVDHINGDATNNNLDNLRINCPMCDSLRHSGLAGIKKTLIIRRSKLNQLEIIEKTRDFYLNYRTLLSPRKIDPKSKKTNILPIEVAIEEKKLKEYKAFFTEKFSFKFLDYIIQ